MPNVPYDNTQLSPDSVQTPRVQTDRPLEDFGGGSLVNAPLGAAQHLNEDVVALQERSYRAAMLASKMNHQNNANTAGLDGLYGTSDADGNYQPGLIQKIQGSGSNAHAVTDEFFKGYDQLADSQISDAKSDQERQMVQKIYANKKDQLIRLVQPHIMAEQQKYEQGAFEAGIQGAQDQMTQAYAHPDVINSQIQAIKDSTDAYGQLHGQPQDVIEQNKSKAISQGYQQVIEKYLNNGQDVQAQQYYDKIKDQITDGKISDSTDKLVRQGTMDGNAQRITDNLVNNYTDKSAMNEAIRDIKDPELQDKVRSKAEPQLAAQLQKSQTEKDNNFLKAQHIAVTQGYAAIPKSITGSLSPDAQKALQDTSNNADGTIPIKNDAKTFNEYMGKSTQDLGDLSQAEVARDVRPNLDDFHFQQFQDKWQSARQGMGGDQKALARANLLQGNDNAVTQAFSDASIAGTSPGESLQTINQTKSKRVVYDQFRTEVQSEIDARQQAAGKPLTPSEVKDVANQVARKNVLTSQPTWYGGSSEAQKNISQLSPEEKQNYSIPITSISDQDKKQLYTQGVLSGGIPANMSYDEAVNKYKVNFQKAAGAAARGADINEIRSIMGTK